MGIRYSSNFQFFRYLISINEETADNGILAPKSIGARIMTENTILVISLIVGAVAAFSVVLAYCAHITGDTKR